MKIPKEQVLEFVRHHDDSDELDPACEQLPDYVDLTQDSELLSRLGVDPSELLGEFNGDASSARDEA